MSYLTTSFVKRVTLNTACQSQIKGIFVMKDNEHM